MGDLVEVAWKGKFRLESLDIYQGLAWWSAVVVDKRQDGSRYKIHYPGYVRRCVRICMYMCMYGCVGVCGEDGWEGRWRGAVGVDTCGGVPFLSLSHLTP